MANLVCKRVSTARQNLVLAEAGIEDPVVFEEDAGTSPHLHSLQRPHVGELLTYARPGDTVHISDQRELTYDGLLAAEAGHLVGIAGLRATGWVLFGYWTVLMAHYPPTYELSTSDYAGEPVLWGFLPDAGRVPHLRHVQRSPVAGGGARPLVGRETLKTSETRAHRVAA